MSAIAIQIGSTAVGVLLAPDLCLQAALRAHALSLAMSESYRTILNELVFSRQLGCDKKTLASYQSTLESEGTRFVLQNLWKESEYISDTDLAFSLNAKKVGDRITAHGLAVAICRRPQDVAAANTRIRQVAIAGAAYGLIERRQVSKTSVSLHGTKLLHEFMTKLAERYIQAIQELVGPLESTSSR